MNLKKFLLGTLAGSIVGFLVSYLIFGIILASYLAANSGTKEIPDMLFIFLGHVMWAAMLTYIFVQWAGISTIAGGARAGAIITVLGALSYNWIYKAISDLWPGGVIPTIVDALGTGLSWAVGGAAIGWVLGKIKE